MSKSFAEVMKSEGNGRRTITHQLCFSTTVNEKYDDLKQKLSIAVAAGGGARKGGDQPARRAIPQFNKVEIAREMAELIEANPGAFYDVILTQVRADQWQACRAEHPPRDGKPQDMGLFNVETFPRAAVVLCMVDPEPTEEILAYFDENLSHGEWQELATKALSVNEGARSRPKSTLASSILAGSASA